MPAYRETDERMVVDRSAVICVANVQCDCIHSGCQVVEDLLPVRQERKLVSYRPGVRHRNLFLSLNSNQFRSAHRLTELWQAGRPDPPTLQETAKVAAAKLVDSGEAKRQVKQKAIDRSQVSLNRRTEKGKGRAISGEVEGVPTSFAPVPAEVSCILSPQTRS